MPLKKIEPEFLVPGDEVAIISPAFAIEEEKVFPAVKVLEEWGLRVRLGRNVFKKHGPFAGTDYERLSDLQEILSDASLKAVICSRGGYGLLRLIEKTDAGALLRHPKWLTGFSDVTVLHLWLTRVCNMASIHGEMPLNFNNPDKSPETLSSLHAALFGTASEIKWQGHVLRPGKAEAEITGGNLSLIYSLIGTPYEPQTRGKILFIEDVGEYYYHLDRMLTSLRLAGKLEGLRALIAGGFNKMEETSFPWGKKAEEIIADAVSGYDYPVCFNFPAGHINDNRAFYIGKRAKLVCAQDSCGLTI
jgi:muramoyltetrapeptide carboxypeptidase